MEEEVQMLLKSADFYAKESAKLLNKIKSLETEEEKKAALKELLSMRSKIKFEINEINKILGSEGPSYDFESMD